MTEPRLSFYCVEVKRGVANLQLRTPKGAIRRVEVDRRQLVGLIADAAEVLLELEATP